MKIHFKIFRNIALIKNLFQNDENKPEDRNMKELFCFFSLN